MLINEIWLKNQVFDLEFTLKPCQNQPKKFMPQTTHTGVKDTRLTKPSGNTTKRKQGNITESIKKKGQRITKNGEEENS